MKPPARLAWQALLLVALLALGGLLVATTAWAAHSLGAQRAGA